MMEYLLNERGKYEKIIRLLIWCGIGIFLISNFTINVFATNLKEND